MRAERTVSPPVPERLWSRPRRLAARSDYDLLLVAALAISLPALVQAPLPLVRAALGLMVVLFAPGYILTAAIFARQGDLDRPARLGFSFVLSAALLPLFGLALDRSPWGITLWPMVICLSGWLLALSGVAAYRRWRLGGEADQPAPSLGKVWNDWRAPRTTLVAGALLILALWVGGLVVSYTTRPALTEFFIVNPCSGLVEFYPRQVAHGESMEVLVGVTNHEGIAVRYRVEARSSGEVVASVDWFTVEPRGACQAPLHYALRRPGKDQSVDILLFHDDRVEAHRHLTLWVNVEERRR